LKEIREHEWNNYDIKIWEEYGDTQKGVREDETALEAIARHMVEVLGENKRKEPYDVYIGRGSKWGNPYYIGRDGTREQVIKKYRKYLLASPLMDDLHELKGKVLGCFCAPKPCHGDILAELANKD